MQSDNRVANQSAFFGELFSAVCIVVSSWTVILDASTRTTDERTQRKPLVDLELRGPPVCGRHCGYHGANASYFTELVLWVGFALFTFSPAGLFIVGISAANLLPRAVATHRWYHDRFPDYPKDRKILVPGLY